jgi:hypothetical protein
MSQDPELRAGDVDRDRTITRLREAYAEGRLSNDEFRQRMDLAQQSRTFGDLDALVTDLPAVATDPASVNAAAPVPAWTGAVAVPEHEAHGLRNGWMSWVGVSLMVNVIWLATLVTGGDGTPYYWPIWVMGPWGAAMIFRTITSRGGD